MSRRYLVAVILVALIARGVFVLQKQEKRSGPIPEDVSIANREPIRSVFSTVAPPAQRSVAVPKATEDACPPTMTQEKIEARDKRQQEHFNAVAQQLSGSDNAESVLAAALLLQGQGNTALDALGRAAQLAPLSPLVAWNILRTCQDDENADCDLDVVAANAIQADGDNGAVWMELAMLHLSQGHPEKAEFAVRSAIAAPRFDSYFIDHAQLIERALEAGGDSTYTERMVTGIGYSAALVVSYYGITKHCRTIDSSEAVWVDLCQQVGEKMYADGRVLLDQAIGTSLVKIATSHTHDAQKIAAAKQREADFRERYRKLTSSVATTNLLANDEAVLRRYVQDLATFGEFGALTRLAAEAARLRQVDGYDQCNFVDPVTGL